MIKYFFLLICLVTTVTFGWCMDHAEWWRGISFAAIALFSGCMYLYKDDEC